MQSHRNRKDPPPPTIAWREQDEVVFDAAALTNTQRAGRACLACARRTGGPMIRVGKVQDGTPVIGCPECAPGIRAATAAMWPPQTLVWQTLRQAANLAFGGPTVYAALAQAAPQHTTLGPHEADRCLGCATLRGAVRSVVEYLVAAGMVPDSQDLPQVIATNADARAWLRAWQATRPSSWDVGEVLRAVELDTFEGVELAPPPRPRPADCDAPTPQRYVRHVLRHEFPCLACTQVLLDQAEQWTYNARRVARDLALRRLRKLHRAEWGRLLDVGAARHQPLRDARNEALAELAERHPEQFHALYAQTCDGLNLPGGPRGS